MRDGSKIVVVEVRSGRYAKRQGLPVVEEEYYYLSGKVDFGTVREGNRRQGRVE